MLLSLNPSQRPPYEQLLIRWVAPVLASLKISVIYKALWEFLSGQGFGEESRQPWPPSPSSLPQTFKEIQWPTSFASLCFALLLSDTYGRPLVSFPEEQSV